MTVNMPLTSLLVCPDGHAVRVLTRILQEMEIRVEACADLEMARARIEGRRFDALLVDCQHESAVKLIAHARNTANKNAVVIALVKGQSEVRGIFANGAKFVLYKPISLERTAHSMRVARSLMRSERRIRPRIPVEAKTSIAYAGKEDIPVALLDLSEEGVAIRSDSKLPPYSKVYFQFALPGNAALVRLAGEVMWQDSSGRVGIRFTRVPQTSRRLLNDWLKMNPALASEAPTESAASTSGDDLAVRLSAGLGLLSASAADRRNLSRQACSLGAQVYLADRKVPTRCTLGDISTGGCYLETAETFPCGTPLEIVVRTEELRLAIRGEVQSTHHGFGMGIRFVLTNEEQKKHVQQLIACARSEPKLSV
jgi:hypothetical protein